MTVGSEDQGAFEALEARIRTILPEEYQDCYDDVQPVSMGSAGLKYGSDGRVAWDDIWETFCDLAMAGGPPHKGTLLGPGSPVEIDAQPERYRQVVEEICRGIAMVTGLTAERSPISGWVRVHCASHGMAGWLVRAIVMENVLARCEGAVLDLPAGPHYRIEKEIKNVITVIAKTCHYWSDHMWSSQQRDISNLFARLGVESPLVQPALPNDDFQADGHRMLCNTMAETIQQATGLRPWNQPCVGWLGLDCLDIRAAIWMMRSMVASNVLSRREGTVFFVPVNPSSDPGGEIVVRGVVRIHGFATTLGIL